MPRHRNPSIGRRRRPAILPPSRRRGDPQELRKEVWKPVVPLELETVPRVDRATSPELLRRAAPPQRALRRPGSARVDRTTLVSFAVSRATSW
jgi:hypothetical protein